MRPRFRPVIRVFVSSTFIDLKAERNILQRDVFPRLEQYCLTFGFQFQAIDLRWGVPGEAGLDHRTMQICFNELRRSQEVSPRPNFLVLLGDRYGWQPLAEQVTESEFPELEKAAGRLDKEAPRDRQARESATQVLHTWYRRDDNADPVVYVLRSRHEWPDGQQFLPEHEGEEWKKVEAVLWAVINRAYPPGGLAGRFEHVPEPDEPLPSIVKFQASATEQEIWRGALGIADAPDHVVAWYRTIRNRSQYSGDGRAKDFFDKDATLHRAASDLKNELSRKLRREGEGSITPVEVDLRPSEDGTKLAVTLDHLATMCNDIEARLVHIIEKEITEYWRPRVGGVEPQAQIRATGPSEARQLELERLAHEQFGESRAPEGRFVGRGKELEAIAQYLGDENDRKPLVVYGPSGTGKTALLARAAKSAAGAGRRIFVRFLGTTPQSSNLRSLLINLCRALRDPEAVEQEVPADLSKLQEEFDRLLASATEDKPILLFLDALDQLDETEGARQTHWLRTPLPTQVKVVLSCIYDIEGSEALNEPYRALERRKLLDRAIAVESLSSPEAMDLLDRWLAHPDFRSKSKRKITSQQHNVIQTRIAPDGAAACRRPLYLRVLCEECRLWPSHKDVSLADLGANTAELLERLFERLEQPAVHGRILVDSALGYIASARRGLSDNEILEVLWSDPEYKKHLDEQSQQTGHEFPPHATRIPIAIWSRLRYDLNPYLAEHAAAGGVVLNFYHREVGRVVAERFLHNPTRCHVLQGRLALYMECQPTSARSCDELPWLLWRSNSLERLRACLLDVDRFLEIFARDPEELRRYWVGLGEESTMGRTYLASFEQWSNQLPSNPDRISYAANQLGFFLNAGAAFVEAEPFVRRALAMAEERYGLDHPEVSVRLSNLANLLLSMNRIVEAEASVRRALAIDERWYGANHPEVATDLSNLASLLETTGRISAAESLYRRALAIDEQNLGMEHPNVSVRLNNIANLLLATNRLAEAELMYRRALDIDEKRNGPEHSTVATDLNNLANFLRATNRVTEAESLVRRALTINERSFGSDHPDVAICLSTLASILYAMHRLAESEPLVRRALAIFEEKLGSEHPSTAVSLASLAMFLQASNRLAEAEPQMRRAVEILIKFTRSAGRPSPHLKPTVNFYAGLLAEMGYSREQILSTLYEIVPEFRFR